MKILFSVLFVVTAISILAPASWAAPDVDVTDIYTPSSLVALQDTSVTAELTNYGDAGYFYLYMYIDGSWVGTWQLYMNSLSWGTVSITITGGLTAGYHTITFCANYCRTEGWTWTGTPDLQLTDIYPPTSLVGGQDSTITARIDNIGNANAGAFYVTMFIDGSYAGSWQVSGLPAQYYTEFSVTISGGLIAGTHSIKFVADYYNNVSESNEGNNQRTESWIWTGTPDLQLTDIYNPTSLTAGQDSTITARIDNPGYANAGPFYVYMYIDGQYAISVDFSSGLPARSYSEVSITILGGLVDGTHTIEFIADSLDEVAESNEENNNRIESWTWTGGIPDLELTDIYDPSSLVSGEDTTITARVTNIGYADANPFYLHVYVDGELVGYFDYSTGLPAWYYSEASVTFLGGLPSGTHDITFIADALDEVAESDETNNEKTETWTWTGPTCTSDIGTGIGVLGDYKSHIDTCYVSSSNTYNLYDMARRANNNPHWHNGQMLPDAAIETHYYGTGLMNDPDNNWNASNQASGVDAHVYAARVYDYLRTTFSLNSFNNQGSSMLSVVEVSSCTNNAGWSQYYSRVNYCVGVPYSGALDVVAHEWGHAVTNNASLRQVVTCQNGSDSAGLCYELESGALNEAFSDWMGTVVEHYYGESNWTLGEDVQPIPDRDLSNPPLYGQPDTYGGLNWYLITGCTPTSSNDYCGVHTNSGVPNKMFYLLSQGGTHPVSNIIVQGIGITKTIQIAYRANMNEWPNNATFLKALEGMVNAAINLGYSANSNEVYQVKNAWAAVGVGTLPIISTSASPSAGGTVSGGGSHEWGKSITVTATPNTGYIFENWTESGNVVSTSASYSFTVTGSRTLVANFTSAPVISVNPPSYDFGSYHIGDTSPLQTFTVTNIGLEVLNIGAVNLAGADASEFAIYINTCTGQYLATNGNCFIQVEFSPTSEGVKNANLSISSNDPVTPVLNLPLTGTGVNDPPVADPGGPYSATEGQTITLNALGSYDPDGWIDLYEWDIDNDGIYDYYSYSSPTLSYTYAQQGTYTVKLRVTDNLGKTDEALTTVTISDTSPTASFTISRTSGIEPISVTFTDASTAYDGIASRSWNFGDGSPAGSGSSVLHTYVQDGIYTVTLTVTDGDGSTAIKTAIITVYDTSPLASFTASPTSGTEPLTVNFTDTSSAYDGISSRSWNFGDGSPAGSGSSVSHVYNQNGTYTVTLTVTDGDGSTDTETTVITVNDTSPTADFTASPTSGTAPLTVNFFNNSTSYDQPLSYQWDFDNNGSIESTVQNPSAIYTGQGIYSVKLTATDSDGSPNSLTRTNYITVTPPVYTLTVTKSGTGSGTVTSSPSGINCGTDCTETYTNGTSVTLTPISDAGSTFTGWTGGGCSGTGNCVITMNADVGVTAVFDASSSLPIRIGSTYYSTLQSAYDAAVNGNVIQTQAVVFTENLNINRNISITLQGGYNADYTAIIGKTSLQGRMTVSSGKVTVKDFILKK